MAIDLTDLVQFLDRCLEPAAFKDYCPNGLQVEGRAQVTRLVTGVTACQSLLDAAVAWEADAILVHHGYFWRGEDQPVVGMKRRRLRTLLGHDISLLAYHLPLDAHPRLGNNACLGRLLGFPPGGPLVPLEDRPSAARPSAARPIAARPSAARPSAARPSAARPVGNVADLEPTLLAGELVAAVRDLTHREPLHIGDPLRPIKRVAWCTGAAQSYLELAVSAGADLFLTGEVSEQTVHVARECGIDFVAAGHHATERYGVQALGEYLAAELGLEHRFIDIENPV